MPAILVAANTSYLPVIGMPMNRTWSSKRGTTLVEILVVIVVLLIGIMTVVQMFPSGFRVVRAAESRTIASKLAEREIERWKNMAASLPTGILPIDENGTVLNAQYPGPPFVSFTPIPSSDAFERGNVLNIRQIYGETAIIPIPSYFQSGAGQVYGSRYTLAFSPIEVWDNNGVFEGLAIKSGELTRRRGNSEFFPYVQAGQYAIDFDEESPQFYVAFPKPIGGEEPLYYIDYSYWIDDGSDVQLVSVISQPITVPKGYGGDWITVNVDVAPGVTFAGFEPDTDSCARGFRPISGPWGSDPYTYYLADPILGVIAFNPTAYGKYEHTSRGLQPVRARIDYRIYDPRIIREDRVIPQPSEGVDEIPIKLALRFILDAGKPEVIGDGDPTDNPDEPTFEGLMRGYNGRPTLGISLGDGASLMVDTSMLIIDLATGLRVSLVDVDIDYSSGVVYLPKRAELVEYGNNVVTEVPLAGRHLRFFYRADGDWSIQCHKAYATYLRDWSSAAEPDYYHYQFDGVARLTFAPCEGGKTVAVDYSYVDADGVEHKVAGESHRIGDSAPYGFELNLPSGAEVRRIYAVVGTSFKARVIWRDGSHWRYVDMDTNLTRSSR